jgi:hypothetical protein
VSRFEHPVCTVGVACAVSGLWINFAPGELHRSFAAKSAAQDDKVAGAAQDDKPEDGAKDTGRDRGMRNPDARWG